MGSETANEKISGYLEKKGKIRMVGGWKKYWFVLESRLLLYYRSKEEYEAISPCKGSISLGPPCNIKPALASTCIFQIESRSNTIILRAENRLEQDKWMQAILGALNLKPNSPTRMTHFRYSADDLAKTGALLINTPAKKQRAHIFSRQNTMPTRASTKKQPPEKTKLNVLEKLRKMSSDSYATRSLENVNKPPSKSSPKLPKSQNVQRMFLNTRVQTLNDAPTTPTIDNIQKDVDRAKIIPDEILTNKLTPNEIITTPSIHTIKPTLLVVTTHPTTNKIDHNKNRILNPENTEYSSRETSTIKQEENIYDECHPYGKHLSSTDKLHSTIQERYYVPQLPPRVKLEIDARWKKRGTFRKIANFVKNDGEKRADEGVKLVRKRSFVNRVFCKIAASKSDENHSGKMDDEEERILINQRRLEMEPSGSTDAKEEHPRDEIAFQKPKGLSSRLRFALAKISSQIYHPARN